MIRLIVFALLTGLAHSTCPPCVKYQNPLPRHLLGFEMNQDKCMCEQDLTRCAVINPVCPAGKQCVLKPIPTCTFTPCQLKSAVCEPFASCAATACTNKCDKSGYILDPNGCKTCVCNDPCQEMTCAADEKCVTVVEIGGGQFGRCDKKEPCPPCVASNNPLPTHVEGIEINPDGCRCSHNLTRCSVINPVCGAGKQCVLRPIPQCTFPPCTLDSVVCEPFTSCPQVSCNTSCSQSGYVKDPNGCQTCACNEPCKEITCPIDKKCVIVIEVGGTQYGRCDPKEACPNCVTYNNPYPVHLKGIEINADGCKCMYGLTRCPDINPFCPKGTQCVLKPMSKCTFPPCRLETADCDTFTSCQVLKCPSSCSQSGFVKDQNGCQTCACNEPCKEITCSADKKCVVVVEVGGTQYARCDPKAACPTCVASVNTLPIHLQGIEINSDGCRCIHNLTRCAIINPVCPKGKQCVLKPLATCTFPPCKLQTVYCEPFTQCTPVTCSNSCTNSGYVADPNGCQTCVCNQPCKELVCPADKKCVTVIEIGGGQTARCDPI